MKYEQRTKNFFVSLQQKLDKIINKYERREENCKKESTKKER